MMHNGGVEKENIIKYTWGIGLGVGSIISLLYKTQKKQKEHRLITIQWSK